MLADTLDRLAKARAWLEGIALAKQSVAKAQTASGTGAGETHIQGYLLSLTSCWEWKLSRQANLVSDISDAKRLLSDAEFKKTIERLIPYRKRFLLKPLCTKQKLK